MDTVVDSVRRLFTEVTSEAEQYCQNRFGRHWRNLARRLGVEKALYDHFGQLFSLLQVDEGAKSTDEASRTVENSLGSTAAEHLKHDLYRMKELLSDLKADLANTSRGTEVLAKLRRNTTVSGGALPRSPLHKRVADLSRANKGLASYLVLQGQASVPCSTDFLGSLRFMLSLDLHGGMQADTIQVTGERLVSPWKSMVSNVASPRQTSHRAGWIEQQASLERQSRHISVRIQSTDHRANDSGRTRPDNSAIPIPDKRNAEPRRDLSEADKENGTFGLFIKETQLPSAVISLEDMILRRGNDFDRRARMEFAFRLSCAVLLLWSSPWPHNPPKWTDWALFFDEEGSNGLWNLYLRRITRPPQEATSTKSPQTSPFSILARDSVLSLLGLRLIELAFGQTLAELRQMEVQLDCGEEQDQQLLDILTAKRLLALHRIGSIFGEAFEDVINVCINQQYRERKDGRIVDLDLHDESFLERAAVTILLPLRDEVRKVHGCACNARLLDGAEQAAAEKEVPQSNVDTRHNADVNLASTNPGHQATRSAQVPDQITHADVLQILTGPVRPLSSEGINSRVPSIQREGSVLVESSDDSHAPSADEWASSRLEHDCAGPQRPSSSKFSRASRPIPADAGLHQPEASFDAMSSESGSEGATEEAQKASGRSVENARSAQMLWASARDGDMTSLYSYDTMTATTDSAFTGHSERTEEPPTIPMNHPLLLFQGIAVRVLLRSFKSWREHGNGQNTTSYAGSMASNSKKRKAQGLDRNVDEENDDEDESTSGAPGVSAQGTQKQASRTFACPFFKKNAIGHTRCCGYILSRIRDVKQHLARRHQIPMYCPRCCDTFNDDDDRDEHIRAARCPARPLLKPEGITESQRIQLRKHAPQSLSQEEQWFGIFDMLFPAHQPRPESPYIDPRLMQDVVAYQRFLSSRGPRILRDVLTASGAVTWRIPPGETDLRAFQHQVLGEGIRAIFAEWTGTGGVPEPEAHNIFSATPSQTIGRVQHGPRGPPGGTPSTGYLDTEQQSVYTPQYFPTTSSSHASSNMSYDGQSDWFAGGLVHMPDIGSNELDMVELTQPMTAADNEDVMGLVWGLRNQRMGYPPR